MIKNFVIIGNGSYAAMMKRYIDLTQFGTVHAFAIEKSFIDSPIIFDTPVIAIDSLCQLFDTSDIQLIMGIGYSQMGNIRKRIFEQCKQWGYTFANFIHPTAIIASNVRIGEGNNILEGVIIEESVCIGDANLFLGGSLIAHETSIGNYNTFSVKSVVAGVVTIKNNCFIGAASTIKDHITLNNYALIGASAYAFKDIDEYRVVVPSKSVILNDQISTDYL